MRETLVLKPCFWMKGMINRMVEGSLRGPLAWYGHRHVDHCSKCGPAYKALLALRDGLKKAGQANLAENILSAERWRQIEEACEDPSD